MIELINLLSRLRSRHQQAVIGILAAGRFAVADGASRRCVVRASAAGKLAPKSLPTKVHDVTSRASPNSSGWHPATVACETDATDAALMTSITAARPTPDRSVVTSDPVKPCTVTWPRPPQAHPPNSRARSIRRAVILCIVRSSELCAGPKRQGVLTREDNGWSGFQPCTPEPSPYQADETPLDSTSDNASSYSCSARIASVLMLPALMPVTPPP